MAEVFNDYFSNIVTNLEIGENVSKTFHCQFNPVYSAIDKFKNHPSILAIKNNVHKHNNFSFNMIDTTSVNTIISNLNTNKPTPLNCIPVKLLVETKDICTPFITKIFNQSLLDRKFPHLLKRAEIIPAHKKLETTNKDNYRPISILPCSSKIFERIMDYQIDEYMSPLLSKYICGFRKGYSTQYCLLAMLECWKKAIDKGHLAGALLTDLSKAFDCLHHELLIAKLYAYGFDITSLEYIYSYLTCREHRTKVNNSFSEWTYITRGIPQGSILGPLLFNIYINDMFFFINENNLANYADDNTPFATNLQLNTLLKNLETDTSILVKWFKDNYFKLNPNKCHLLVTKHSKDVTVTVDGETIMGSPTVKLLGINVDNKLNFNDHVSKLCCKVSQKIHALARISPYMSTEKLRCILRAFIQSQFGYCPLVWMYHSRTLNNRINRLHERALRITYKDSTLSFKELLALDHSFTIHERNVQHLATEMYKIKNNLAPTFMKELFPLSTNIYNLRNKPQFKTSNVHTVSHGTETISFRGPKTWAIVPDIIKQSKTLDSFKRNIKHWRPEGCSCKLCLSYIPNLGFL